jgi:hypothetical protein
MFRWRARLKPSRYAAGLGGVRAVVVMRATRLLNGVADLSARMPKDRIEGLKGIRDQARVDAE